MKKACMILGIAMMFIITSCGSNNIDEESENIVIYEEEDTEDEVDIEESVVENEASESSEDGIDVDLTTLSSTMVYAEVYNMYKNPDEYIGKIVKMEGAFSVYEVVMSGSIYFSVIIEDALGCCSQGIEFELNGDYTYPGDYPEVGIDVIVVGEFETYYEGETMYCRLKDAVFEEN